MIFGGVVSREARHTATVPAETFFSYRMLGLLFLTTRPIILYVVYVSTISVHDLLLRLLYRPCE